MQIIQPTDATLFSWNTTDKTGTAFASDLGFRAGQTPGSQVYDDAADHGFLLENTKKGTTMLFVLKDWYPQIVNGEATGEGHWEYVGYNTKTRRPEPVRLVIFND